MHAQHGDEQRERGDDDEAGVRDDLVRRLAPAALAAVVALGRERERRGQREQARSSRRVWSVRRIAPDYMGRRSLDRMAVVIASDLAKDMAGEPLLRGVSFRLERRERMTLSGPQRLGQDDAAADARGRDLGRRRRARVRQGHAGRAARPAPAARARPLAARLRALGRRKELLAIEERLAELEQAMAEGATDAGHARRLRDGAGAARARRRLRLARGRQRDAARARLPRRATSTARSRRSPAAS